MSQEPDIRVTENKMGTQPVGRLLAGMAIPMMISMLVQALYNIVDSVFVSRLSENALTAVSLAFPLQNLMIAVCAGTTVGMNALLSRSLGAKEQERADRAANTGIFLALASFVVFAIVGALFSRTFFLLQTDVPEIVDYGTDYARVCLCCSIGLFCQFTFERLLQSTGRTHLSMCTQILGAVTNIVLDPILIFGLLGFPRLEVMGAAVATVVGQCLAAVAALILNLKKNPDIHIRPRHIRWHGATVKNIYRIGLPSIVMQCIGSVMVFGVNRILISFTTTATAVFGIYFKLQSFIFMPVFGLNSGTMPIMGYNYGAHNRKRIMEALKYGCIYAFSIMCLGMLIFQRHSDFMLRLFEASDEMMAIGVPALKIISYSFPFAALCIMGSSLFQAIGDGRLSFFSSALRQLAILLPVAFIFSRTLGLSAVWYAFPISELGSITFVGINLYRIYQNKIKPMGD